MSGQKQMIKLFVPIFIEQLLATVITMFGTMMVSAVSSYAVSGVGLVDTINYLIVCALNAINGGITVVAAHCAGRKDYGAIGRIGAQSLTLAVEASVLIAAVLIIFQKQLLAMLFGGAEWQVLEAAGIYLKVSSLSLPLQSVYAAMAGMMRAVGDTKSPMIAAFFADVAYLLVGGVCIYVLKIGVLGAGLGLLASRCVSSVLAYRLLKKGPSGVVLPKFSWKLDFHLLAPVLQISIPTAADSIFFNGGKLIVQIFLSGMGTALLAANSIAMSISDFINIPGNSMCMLTMIVVGQVYGTGRMGKTRKTMFAMLRRSCLLLSVFCVVLLPMLNPFISLYHPSPETFAAARQVLLLMIAATPVLWSTAFNIPHMLRASGDVKFSMIISIVSMLIARVGGAWFFGVYLKGELFGVWLSMVVDWVFRTIFYLPRIVTGGWCRNFKERVREEQAQQEVQE